MKLGNPEDRGFDSERLQRIDRFLDETYLDTGRLAMMQLLVSRDGHPVHYYHGGTLRDDGTPMREDALFRIASMTKPVTSIAFMQLVEKCKVALEDPVSRVLPEFEGLGAYAGGGGDLPFAPTSINEVVLAYEALRRIKEASVQKLAPPAPEQSK